MNERRAMGDVADALLATSGVTAELTRGVTDSATIKLDEARRLVASLDDSVCRIITAMWILDDARDTVRSANLETERAAQRVREREEEQRRDEERRASLYLGKYRHGSISERDGAVWHGCTCDYCESTREREARMRERHNNELFALISAFERDLKMEWTRELLQSSFALGDGTTVTWAAATVEDHETRIAMLAGNARANIEAAARHEAALRTIREAGAETLAGALRESEAAA